MRLDVTQGKESKKFESDTPEALGRLPARPTLTIHAGDEIALVWKVSALDRNTTTYKDITLHAFVTAAREPGQTRPPVPDEKTLFESALFMDFPPGAAATGDARLRVEEPGLYLVRIETLGLVDVEAHEHGALIDLMVLPAADAPGARAGTGPGEKPVKEALK